MHPHFFSFLFLSIIIVACIHVAIRVTRLKLSFVCPYLSFLSLVFIVQSFSCVCTDRNCNSSQYENHPHAWKSHVYRHICVHNTFHLSIDILGVFTWWISFHFLFFLFSLSLFLSSFLSFSIYLSIYLSMIGKTEKLRFTTLMFLFAAARKFSKYIFRITLRHRLRSLRL